MADGIERRKLFHRCAPWRRPSPDHDKPEPPSPIQLNCAIAVSPCAADPSLLQLLSGGRGRVFRRVQNSNRDGQLIARIDNLLEGNHRL